MPAFDRPGHASGGRETSRTGIMIVTSNFVFPATSEPVSRSGEHGGRGPISYRRLMTEGEFETKIDFVDFTVIPPGSTIGLHEHQGNEEIYFIAAGRPLVRVDGQEARLSRGCLAVVRNGGRHELINDTPEDVEILVIQVRV